MSVSVLVEDSKCTTCWNCVDACPSNVFEIKDTIVPSNGGYRKTALVVNESTCIVCLRCEQVCEANCITVTH
ncbi:MAG: ferredoxin family protein [Candidatus Bathyarchaeia archaeon]